MPTLDSKLLRLILFLFFKKLFCATAAHITCTFLREADISLTPIKIHDVPQRQSAKATFMRGFTERLVGFYTDVWTDEMWNDFMPADEEAPRKRNQSSSAGEATDPYVPPDVFKVRKLEAERSIAGSVPNTAKPKPMPTPE